MTRPVDPTRNRRRRLALALSGGGIALAALGLRATAGEPRALLAPFAPKYQWNGTLEYDNFGGAVAGAQDVDKDGTPDIVVGAPWDDPGGLVDAGSAYVYSGKTGTLLRQFHGTHPGDHFGYSVAGAGDADKDGYPDIVVGARDEALGSLQRVGAVYVYSGKTSALLWQFHASGEGDLLGWAVAGLGDVDKDGYADVAASAPYTDPNGKPDAGAVYVLSGHTGAVLYRLDGENTFNPSDSFGLSLAGPGDIDGDTYPDVFVGVPHWDPQADNTNAGGAWLYSGKTGALLHRFAGTHYLDYFGWSVTGIGDVNHDGFGDLAVGAFTLHDGQPQDYYSWKIYGGFYVFSGKDYSQLLRVVSSQPYEYLGNSIAAAGDVDRNGVPDILVGAPHANSNGVFNSGAARVYSIAGTVLQEYKGANRGDTLGWTVAGIGDISSDVIPDVAVGVPNLAVDGAARAGAAIVYASTPTCGGAVVGFNEHGRLAWIDLGILMIPASLLILVARRRARAAEQA